MYLVNLIISAVLALFTSLFLICSISKIKIKSLLEIKKIIIFLILVSIVVINNIIFNGLDRVLINIFAVFLLNLGVIFDYDNKKSVYYTIVYFIFCSFGEFFTSIISTSLLNFSLEKYNSFVFSTTIFTLLNGILMILISFIKPLTDKICDIYIKINKKSFVFMIFAVSYLFLICFNIKQNLGKNVDYYTTIGLYIFILIFILFIFQNTIKRLKYESEYEILQRNLIMYEKEVNRQGKKNHEYNNQLMVLKGYVNNPKKLNEYLDLLIEEHKGGQNFRIKQLGYLPDGGFKGLLYNKLALMEDYKIKSYLYVSSNLKKFLEDIDVKYYSDLTKIFGIFVDNAIDATKEAKKKEIIIDLKIEDEYLIIEISNTYNKDIDIKKIGKKGYTSKGIGHGFGLSIVKDIKNSSDLIDTYTEVEDNMFKQTIIAKIK